MHPTAYDTTDARVFQLALRLDSNNSSRTCLLSYVIAVLVVHIVIVPYDNLQFTQYEARTNDCNCEELLSIIFNLYTQIDLVPILVRQLGLHSKEVDFRRPSIPLMFESSYRSA
jgi:hypothetical protein